MRAIGSPGSEARGGVKVVMEQDGVTYEGERKTKNKPGQWDDDATTYMIVMMMAVVVVEALHTRLQGPASHPPNIRRKKHGTARCAHHIKEDDLRFAVRMMSRTVQHEQERRG